MRLWDLAKNHVASKFSHNSSDRIANGTVAEHPIDGTIGWKSERFVYFTFRFNELIFIVSSPSRTTADEGSGFGEEKEKERDDFEILRIYDGNSSLRNQVFRLASVPKIANCEQIRDIALRRFHINDTPDNYYVTQAPFEGEFVFLRRLLQIK